MQMGLEVSDSETVRGENRSVIFLLRFAKFSRRMVEQPTDDKILKAVADKMLSRFNNLEIYILSGFPFKNPQNCYRSTSSTT